MNVFSRTLSALAGLFCFTSASLHAQNLLDKRISIDVTNQRLADVLKLISNKANFYFSYNSNIIKRDSLITLSASNKTIKQLLEQLLSQRYQYQEVNNYIILRRAPASATTITRQVPSKDKIYTISGYVINSETGEKISNASVYEKERLVSTLTNDSGYYVIKLKSRYSTASLSISRQFFEDTTITIQPKYNQQLNVVMSPIAYNEQIVTISPLDYNKPESIAVALPPDTARRLPVTTGNKLVEKTAVGKFLLSAKQKIQSINIGKFFADRPFQGSVIPGVSTHGKFSGQVINNVSINMFGGYTGGTNGFELGGLFNIDKEDAQYLQAAGLFNIVGGSVKGAQLAGIQNTTLGRVTGLQAAGISNFVKGKFTGLQMSGIHNHVTDSVTGFQVAGISNYAQDKVTGVQMAGIGNFANRTMTGVQVAGIINYAKRVKGVQIGLINIADTSEGYSIGLINFVLKGYHKMSYSTNEVMRHNIALKSGNTKLYSILLLSANTEDSAKAVSIGYGLGHQFSLGKHISLNPELTSQIVFLGDEHADNILTKFHLNFNVNITKYLAFFIGPSFNIYYSNQPDRISPYKFKFPSSYYPQFDLWDDYTKGWIGFNAGISIF
jgi:hypothetical protein